MQQFDDFGPVFGLLLAENAQRQRHILVGGQVVEQPEILKDDTDPPPQIGAAVLAQRRRILIEHADQAARRPQRQQHQPQQRGLAGARRAGEELEGMPVDPEIEVAQHLGAKPIAQADILEPDHAVLRTSGILANHDRVWFFDVSLIVELPAMARNLTSATGVAPFDPLIARSPAGPAWFPIR